MTPDISVVIAAYNVEAYIERAIRSALDQQHVLVEVIVVDDASTDKTVSVASEINDSRVKLIKLAANGGPSAARNAGFAVATAPWIAVLDGDDAFLPDRLMRCRTRAKALNADIVVDNLEVFREADSAHYPMFAPADFTRLGMLDLRTFIAGNCSFLGGGIAYGYLKPMFSTAFLRQYELSYDREIRIGEDYMLLAEALAHGARCVVEPSLGYAYTVRAGSISHRLSLADVTRIANGDKKFIARYRLDGATARAQAQREHALKEAFAYTNLLNALKQRDVRSAMAAIGSCPKATRHLWRPLWLRIKRLAPGKTRMRSETKYA